MASDQVSPRRAFASAAVIGDYLYVDAGEFATYADGKYGSPPSAQVNTTLAVSLKSEWTNSTLKWIETSRANVPKLKEGAFWVDLSTKSFYAWAGGTSYGPTPPPNELWKFSTDGNGGGSWSRVEPLDVVSFGALVKPSVCASAWGKDRVGYCFGGGVDRTTDTSISSSSRFPIPGVVTFDMEARTFANRSTQGMGPKGVVVSGRAEAIPYGPNAKTSGMVVVLGGGDGSSQFSFATLPVYDPAEGKWYTQATTGSRPTPRERFCTVGAQGDNGTYEIFLYGGIQNQPQATTSDEIFILSLPGFVFFKAPSALSAPRNDHACAADGRQLISVGGSEGQKGYPKSWTDGDPWAQGVGVYDMVELRWTPRFDASRPPYRTPDVVKQWYNQGGLRSVVWSSDEVKGLFVPSSSSASSSSALPSTSSPSSAPSESAVPSQTAGPKPPSSPASPEQELTSTGLSTGAIAGISVGGAAALAVLATLLIFFCILPRRRRGHPPAPTELAANSPPVSDATWYSARAGELQVGPEKLYAPPHFASEMSANSYLNELGTPPAELYAEHGRQELSSVSSIVSPQSTVWKSSWTR